MKVSERLSHGADVVCVDPRYPYYGVTGVIVGVEKSSFMVEFSTARGVHRALEEKQLASLQYVRDLHLHGWIGRVVVHSSRKATNFEIPLGDPARHLILTGPNGSGKTSILEAILEALREPHRPRPVETRWGGEGPRVSLVATEEEWAVLGALRAGVLLRVYIGAYRNQQVLEMLPVEGPRAIPWATLNAENSVSHWFLQYLVNRRSEQALLREGGEEKAADRIADWFAGLMLELGQLFSEQSLLLKMNPRTFQYRFVYGDGREVSFQQLPSGFASIVAIWAEILLREEAWKDANSGEEGPPGGVVLIDELETHLHLKLQEQILPFLTRMFPKYQFIVATHSPLVIASVSDAVVFDLGTMKRSLSAEYQGIRYGTLMSTHFQLPDDVDARTRGELVELDHLLAQVSRTAAEDTRLDALATHLSQLSPLLNLEIWRRRDLLRGRASL